MLGPLKSEIFLTRTRMTLSSTLGTLETLEVVGMKCCATQLIFGQSSLRTYSHFPVFHSLQQKKKNHSDGQYGSVGAGTPKVFFSNFSTRSSF